MDHPGADSATDGRNGIGIGVYIHVPYCSSRCGYCDFNTYVPGEEGRGNPSGWADAAIAEIELQARVGRGVGQADAGAGRVVGDAAPMDGDAGPASSGASRTGGVSTVFIGGGTPTLLAVDDLRRVITSIDAEAGLIAGAEITVEANPETISAKLVDDLLGAGINRISIGMQSSDPQVLRALERQHTPGQAVAAAKLARSRGFDRVSLDLIYAAPGEDQESWSESLDAAIDAGVDHVSAYALKLEPNTRLTKQVARGDVVTPDDDYAAAAYEMAEARLSAAGLFWYEISNWARPGSECRHNLGYWRSGDWWGIGPGAHGHWRGRRHWNKKHPQVWQDALAGGQLAEAGYEVLTEDQQFTERIMLGIRLREGLSLESIGLHPGHSEINRFLLDGLVIEEQLPQRLVLTTRGRLLADMVTLRLLEILGT